VIPGRGRNASTLASVIALGALGALGAGVALGASETITTSAVSDTFTKNNFATDQGEVVRFQNTSLGSTDHNVTSAANGPDGKKLFRTPDIGAGQSAAVNGTQYLTQDKYHFTCTLHPGMEADLTVSGNGTPVPRPDIELKVLSRKLDRVVGSGRMKVRVTAQTESDDVDFVAKKGAKKLASKSGVDLGAGDTRRLRLKLTNAGEAALDDLDRAKVKVTGTVPFGAPDSAKRTLR
jgi:plastocyanin